MIVLVVIVKKKMKTILNVFCIFRTRVFVLFFLFFVNYLLVFLVKLNDFHAAGREFEEAIVENSSAVLHVHIYFAEFLTL